MAVDSDASDLARAFRRHMSTAQITNICRRSRIMALFYAAECGLKLIFMEKHVIPNTNGLRVALKGSLGIDRIDLHDLEKLCSANYVTVPNTTAPPSFTVGPVTHEPYRIHEAARYGVKLPHAFLANIENWLSELNTEVEKRIQETGN